MSIRINRYLAEKGIASRRHADKLIEQGLVKINGRKAKLGDQVSEGDTVEVDQKVTGEIAENRQYFAFYKPRGVVTHPTGLRGEKSIRGMFKKRPDLFPIGRLDKESEGLIIMTNDGRITERLLGPEHQHEKEYVVKVDKKLRPFFLRNMEEGVNIEGYRTRPAKVSKLNDASFCIILTEGKHHQIRRMAAAFNYAVRELKRVRIMSIKLGNLKPGASREIKGKELQELLNRLNK